jgi:hypothetical protein
MISYPELGFPSAWKPLFQAMAAAGWDLEAALGPQAEWECVQVLRFICGSQICYLSLFQESEWCGNAYQAAGLTVVGLSAEFPEDRAAAEEYSLVLTGDWGKEALSFVADFSRKVV